jgi:hypothetical protein
MANGRPGRASKGDRKQLPTRMPVGIHAVVVARAAAFGVPVSDAVVALAVRGLTADVDFPPEVRTLLSKRAAASGQNVNTLVVQLVAKGLATDSEALWTLGSEPTEAEVSDFVVALVVQGLAAGEQLQLSA